jgi:hypothetical protein
MHLFPIFAVSGRNAATAMRRQHTYCNWLTLVTVNGYHIRRIPFDVITS